MRVSGNARCRIKKAQRKICILRDGSKARQCRDYVILLRFQFRRDEYDSEFPGIHRSGRKEWIE